MTVGVKGPNNLPVPAQVSQVDASAKGVKIKNPTTHQDEWANIDDLQPYMTADSSPEAGAAAQGEHCVVEELARMRQLAGIKENCSGGATGAGAIAIAPAAMGTVKKRQYPEESLEPEYERTTPAKTVYGDTKPNQASGKLSADLAASGKISAARGKRKK
jgi:hypothetical protein